MKSGSLTVQQDDEDPKKEKGRSHVAWWIGEQAGAHPDPRSILFLACRGHRASKKGVGARGWKLYHRPLHRPSTQGSTFSLSLSLFLSMFNPYPSNTPDLRLFLARNPVSQGTRRAGRQWETVRLSWRATGSRGDSWFVRGRLSSTTFGFARATHTLSHPVAPLLARHRPKYSLHASIRVPWGVTRSFQPQLRLRTSEPPPPPLLFPSAPCDPGLRTPPSSHPYSANTSLRPSSLDHRRSVLTCSLRMLSPWSLPVHPSNSAGTGACCNLVTRPPSCHGRKLNSARRSRRHSKQKFRSIVSFVQSFDARRCWRVYIYSYEKNRFYGYLENRYTMKRGGK